jgi:hypothetical protein
VLLLGRMPVRVLLLVEAVLLAQVSPGPAPVSVLDDGTRAKWWQRQWRARTPGWERPNRWPACEPSAQKTTREGRPKRDVEALVGVVAVVVDGADATLGDARGPLATSPRAPRSSAPR